MAGQGVDFKWAISFVLLNVVVALAMKQVPLVAAIHAFVTLTVGVYICFKNNQEIQIAQWAAYIVGAEVLWRMSQAPIPWEFGKHSIWLICLLSMLRSPQVRTSWFPALYFVLLIPGAFPAFLELSADEARKEVIFALSGPICFATCASCFSTLRVTAAGFQRLCLMAVAPIVGMAAVVLVGIDLMHVDFNGASNADTSGGYGPNQVSAMLSLGALFALLMQVNGKLSVLLRGGLVIIILWLLAQSAMTFSRTGIYLFGAAFGIAAVFLSRAQGKGRSFLLLVLVLGALSAAVLPMIDTFTGGKLTERFNDTGLTGRDHIVNLDLLVWRDHPIFGAGAGLSMFYRAAMGDEHVAHTEYSRLVADHGLLGAAALAFMVLMTVQAFLRARDPSARAIVSAMGIWALLFMAGTGMRLAAPGFLLGLIHARFLADKSSDIQRPTQARGLSNLGARLT